MAGSVGIKIPNENLKKLIEAPAIKPSAETQFHRIKCPMCQAGHALVPVEIRQVGPMPAEKEVKFDKDRPYKCELCGVKLAIHAQLKIVATPWRE